MKTIQWTPFIGTLLIYFAIVAIPFYFDKGFGSNQAPFSIALVVCGCVSFIGVLGFFSWVIWLDFRENKELHDKILQLQVDLLNKNKETAGLKEKLAEMEGKLRNLQPELSQAEKRLYELAEKLRTKTTRETNNDGGIVTMIDEVPENIRGVIVTILDNFFPTEKGKKVGETKSETPKMPENKEH